MRHQQHRFLIFLIFLIGFGSDGVRGDLSDSDSMDQETTSQMGGTADEGSDYTDPNINTPRGEHMGFQGGRMIPEFTNGRNNKGNKPNQGRSSSKTNQAKQDQGTEVKINIFNMTVEAIMQMGIIVGVAILMMSLFMGMVGLEILMDKALEKYRQMFNKPEPLPDIERLHPAELVGKFSRYK